MKITVDRIIVDKAVVISDSGCVFDIPAEVLNNPKEGFVYEIGFDEKETQKRTERVKKITDEIWE